MKDGNVVRETQPQHISYWIGKVAELPGGHKSKKYELTAYDRLLLTVDKVRLNIPGVRPSPEDTLELVRLIIELELNRKPILFYKSALCFIQIKEILLQKISHAPRGMCNKKWHAVVTELKQHPKLLKERYYRRLFNYIALLV